VAPRPKCERAEIDSTTRALIEMARRKRCSRGPHRAVIDEQLHTEAADVERPTGGIISAYWPRGREYRVL